MERAKQLETAIEEAIASLESGMAAGALLLLRDALKTNPATLEVCTPGALLPFTPGAPAERDPKRLRFKMGERVRYAVRTVPRGSECRLGTLGTVLGPDLRGWYDYTVRWDSCPDNLHFVNDGELTPIEA
jgi:hypothetical protein